MILVYKCLCLWCCYYYYYCCCCCCRCCITHNRNSLFIVL